MISVYYDDMIMQVKTIQDAFRLVGILGNDLQAEWNQYGFGFDYVPRENGISGVEKNIRAYQILLNSKHLDISFVNATQRGFDGMNYSVEGCCTIFIDEEDNYSFSSEEY